MPPLNYKKQALLRLAFLISFRHIQLTKSSRNVIFCLFILRYWKQFFCIVVFHNFSEKEKRRIVRHTHCLLHVMRNHDNRIIFFQLHRKVFDLWCGDRVKRRSIFSSFFTTLHFTAVIPLYENHVKSTTTSLLNQSKIYVNGQQTHRSASAIQQFAILHSLQILQIFNRIQSSFPKRLF